MVRDAGGSVCFLPPYSPDLNPIELVFGATKKLLRERHYWSHTRANARLSEQLICNALSESVHKAGHMRNYIAHCGYRF